MFLMYEGGVVLVDAPPAYASKIGEAVREITDKPITGAQFPAKADGALPGCGSWERCWR